MVELELCLLSMAYLNFSAICTPGRDALISDHIAFYDYVVASWVHHLMAWLSETGHDKSDILELEETFGQFLDQHFSDECRPSNVSNQMHENLRLMKDFESYDSLTQAIVWSRKQLLVANSLKDDEDTQSQLDFPRITQRIRSLLEDTARANPAPEIRAALELYYGRKWFRCPKIYSRHERAYSCTFDGCRIATIGCVSKKGLDKYLLETHGVGGDGGDFPNVPNPNATGKQPATFQCTLCPKRFTRAHNLRSHLRTYTNERLFFCTVCGKCFARNHDRKTQEDIHSGEKRFSSALLAQYAALA
ncbi:hypothetical protein B0T24DRAFT_657112 [Lasiosphaeria ovina]|uniref:C2H2-type domain-containing protein n=1 Tax=Lasiosphaeria ovina TaxID=92902 RepID=A0AAE0KBK9_9PEZI|nr:hypothetical protein B0T24DRAFT_657112 [Lasiosphaeria ovina]